MNGDTRMFDPDGDARETAVAWRGERSIAATLCMVSAAASMTGLLALSTLGHSPLMHSLTWFAVASYGFAAPLAFAGYVLSLLPTASFTSTRNGRPIEGTMRHVPLAIDLGAATGAAGLFAGAACMTTALLSGADNMQVGAWSLYAYAVVFIALASVLIRARLASRVARRAFEPTNGFMPPIQLVTDNTRPRMGLGRVKALQQRRLRINPFAQSELHDFSRKYGCTPDQVRAACVAVGTLADDLSAHLAKMRESSVH